MRGCYPIRGYWTYGFEEAVRRWADHHDCAGPLSEDEPSPGIVRAVAAGCRGDGAMETYSLSGLGHTWPGSTFAFPTYLGATDDRIDATELSIRFFKRFSLAAD